MQNKYREINAKNYSNNNIIMIDVNGNKKYQSSFGANIYS